MKKLIFAAALLLSAAGGRSPFHFNDPIAECPPACGTDTDDTGSGTGKIVRNN